MSNFEYLDEERVKIWKKIGEIESALSSICMNTPKEEIELKKNLREAIDLRNSINSQKRDLEQTLKELIELKNQLTTTLSDTQIKISEINKNHTAVTHQSVEANNLINKIGEEKSKIEAIGVKLESILPIEAQSKSALEEIEKTQAASTDTFSKIEAIHKNALTKRKELDSFYYEIFGEIKANAETGENEEIPGKKHELENTYKQLTSNIESCEESIEKFQNNSKESTKTQIEKWNTEVEAIKTKINQLLPNALTAGLSHAYSAKKEDEKTELIAHKKSFDSAIRMMMAISSIPIIFSFYQVAALHLELKEAILQLPRLVMAIIPIYVPALWIAYTSSKKANLSKRLIEEYSHKEALGKTYEGLSGQINGLEDSNIADELKIKLLFNILEVSSENPGKLISDYNKSDHPIMDALDKSVKLTDSLAKLGRVPGFSKLADKLAQNAESALESQRRKADAALDTVPSQNSKS